jgi:hypothetical protein
MTGKFILEKAVQTRINTDTKDLQQNSGSPAGGMNYPAENPGLSVSIRGL